MMVGVDNLIARSLHSVIQVNLSEQTIKKLDNRLVEKYGITLSQAVEDFQKLDDILREFFGEGAVGLERKIFESICTVSKVKNKDEEWMTIRDSNIAKTVLEAFGDEDKKKIMSVLMNEPHIVSEVLSICNLPQTSGYRKINSMISDGLLTVEGYITTSDGKKVNKYTSIFENIKIDIVKNNVTVKVKLKNDSVKNSILIPLIRN
ncbi:MAG TPA: transcriptional regulator [Nitrosopumilaceae archaeon]|nr:transcriptional regulator [Nitrosopumilaceae archaeon]